MRPTASDIECPYCGWCGEEHELEDGCCPECEEILVEEEELEDAIAA